MTAVQCKKVLSGVMLLWTGLKKEIVGKYFLTGVDLDVYSHLISICPVTINTVMYFKYQFK